MTIYKADLKTNIYYILGFVVLFAVTIPLSIKFLNSSWTILIIFLMLFFVFHIITLTVNEIQLDTTNQGLTLICKNYIGIKKSLKYDFRQIKFTYKRQAISFRGGIKDVCTIYSADKKVIQLVPDNDNWSGNEIRRFVYGLIEAGVKKKFIGYSLKDVEI